MPQINLYFTDTENGNTESIQKHCLRVVSATEEINMNRQIMFYCISELLSEYTISNNQHVSQFSFAELSEDKITSEQLYRWSAPIDLIEHYQSFISNVSSLGEKIFYNCTLPRFGPKCQYEFNDYQPYHHTSLYEIISDFYQNHPYLPTEFTCYIHLKCDRGPFPTCLDWSEICDGTIDCHDGGQDEEHCWQLEINECKEDEYRCINGQCIPKVFYRDNEWSFDCLDQSDQYSIGTFVQRDFVAHEPVCTYEDVICIDEPLTSSCEKQRSKLLRNTLYSVKDQSVSDDCWFALKNMIDVPDSSDFVCFKECLNITATDIIERTCLDMIFIPAIPVLFNEIYFAYHRNDSNTTDCLPLLFPYICYNNSLYDNFFVNKSAILFNKTKCFRPDNPRPTNGCIKFSWINHYVQPIYAELKKYILIFNYTSTMCNRINMYRCRYSEKCISIYRLLDSVNDCPYNDDEDITKINHTYALNYIERHHINCSTSNKYISPLVFHNDRCDCQSVETKLCEDEGFVDFDYIKNYISFQTICDSYIELSPMIIDGRMETDETECEQWLCDNIYTHCNGYWNCPNGEDEIGCYSLPSIKCSSDEHMCVILETYQLKCLPLSNVNDGIIDCVGAMDEPYLCYRNTIENNFENFYCLKLVDHTTTCIDSFRLCDGLTDCIDESDEKFCNPNRVFKEHETVCSDVYQSIRSDTEYVLCEHFSYTYKQTRVYLTLDKKKDFIDETDQTPASPILLSDDYMEQPSYCHRGIPAQLWVDEMSDSTKTICFCPPSFYGDRCQYQNQRISLSIRFRSSSNSWQTPFVIVVLLVDNTDQRIIHSYEQFSYLPVQDCQIKFHLYLLYSTRPKDPNKIYAIHIDIYEKTSLSYRGSLFMPILFPFLPVYRLSTLVDIPQDNNTFDDCSINPCVHGKCMKYSNQPQNDTFCQCKAGWSGRYCTIPYTCICSIDSLCLGMTAHRQPICVCPLHRFGSRCFLKNTICSNATNSTCENGGQCIPNDESIGDFTCICPNGYMGKRCEILENQLVISFGKNVLSSQSILIHFIQIFIYEQHQRATTFRTIPYKQDSIIIHWSKPFHLVFIEFPIKNYYFTVLQKNYSQSTIINTKIQQKDRCYHINEIFNKSIVQLRLLRRLKYYQLPCQNDSLELACFYDDIHLCFCQSHIRGRVANCFEFDHNMTFDCLGQSVCENNGQCFQDSLNCSKRSLCICRACYYGIRCQFSTTAFGLSLDAILSYHIQQHISLISQPEIIQISFAFTILFIIIGLTNSICTLMTFKSRVLREVGCGFYLLASSITTLAITIIFGLKFCLLILAQMGLIINRSFLIFQCYTNDFLLQCCLNMNHWLTACVAIERAVTTIKTIRFNKQQSRQSAKKIICILIVFVICTNIHDPIYRRLIDEENEEEKRTWCIASYSSALQKYNYTMNIFHFLAPFLFNLISVIILFVRKTDQQSNVHTHRTYKDLFIQHACRHKHLVFAPIAFIILALPRLILSFTSKCMNSTGDSWFYLIGYFISFIPHTLTFVVFVFPSKYYLDEYRRAIRSYRMNFRRYLLSFSNRIRDFRINRIRPI